MSTDLPPDNQREMGPAVRSSDLLSDDELRRLLDAAERIKLKPAAADPKKVVMELYEVIGTLWQKGMTRKQMLAWMKKRGYTFKDHHLGMALRHYHETKVG